MKLSAFYPLVLPLVPGCPEVTVDHAVVRAAAEFCRETGVWRLTDRLFTTKADESDYEIFPAESNTRIEWLEEVEVAGTRIKESAIREPAADATGEPVQYFLAGPRTVRLLPTPDAAYAVTGAIVMAPTLSATAIDDTLFEDWAETIASGALMRLTTMPGAWGSPDLARYHNKLFRRGVTGARARKLRAGTTATVTAQHQKFGG